MVLIIRAVERLRRRRQVAAKRGHVLIEFTENHVGSVHSQLEWLGRLSTIRADLILVAQKELARSRRTPPAIWLQHAIPRIPRHVSALNWRLGDWISKSEMLALGPDPVCMRERHRILNEPDLDAAGRLHLGAKDPGSLFAPLIRVGSEPGHGMNVGTPETAFPKFRRV